MKRLNLALCCTMLLSGCTLAKISGRGSIPLILNNPTQTVTVLSHFQTEKRITFDYTSAFDVSEVIGDQLRANPTADAVTNLTITVKSGVADFFINLFTLGLAQSKVFAVEGDVVKLGSRVGALMQEGTVVGQAERGDRLNGFLTDFAGEPSQSPTIVKTDDGLAIVRLR